MYTILSNTKERKERNEKNEMTSFVYGVIQGLWISCHTIPCHTMLLSYNTDSCLFQPQKETKEDYRFIVTVILLLCTSRQGGRSRHSTSMSLTYASLPASSAQVPSIGDGSVVNITAVFSPLCRTISSFRIRCCARQGRSLKDSGMAACAGKPEADAADCC